MNITRLHINDLQNYDVLKSEYNDTDQHYVLQIKHNGTQIEGTYSLDVKAKSSIFGLNVKSSHDFIISTFPIILKIQWTFGNDAKTKKLIAKDFDVSVDALEHGSLTMDKIFDHFSTDMGELKSVLASSAKNVLEAVQNFIFSNFNGDCKMKKNNGSFNSVQEMTEEITRGERVYDLFRCLDKRG